METPLTHEEDCKPISPFQSILGAFQTSEDVEVQSAASDDVRVHILRCCFFLTLRLLRTKQMVRWEAGTTVIVHGQITYSSAAPAEVGCVVVSIALHANISFALVSRVLQAPAYQSLWIVCGALSQLQQMHFQRTS